MSLSAFQALVAELGQSLGAPDLSAGDDGYVGLKIDEIDIHIQYEAEGDAVVLFARLQEIEPDRRDAVAVEQLLDQRRHGVTAPRPAPHAFQAGLVDVEDGHAIVLAGWRSALQPDVIQPGLGTLHGGDMDQPAHMRRDQQNKQRRQACLRQPGRNAPHRRW